jgi:hypothetical protein
MNANDVMRNLFADLREAVDRARAFTATAIGTQSAGLITIQRLESLTADGEAYGRLKGFAVANSDALVCMETRGGGTVVLGTLQNAAPTLYTLDAGLTFTGTAPTVTAAAGAGTTGAISGTNGFDSNYGFTVTPGGTGIAAGALATVLFGTARTDGNYNVLFTRRTANSGPLQFYLSSRTTSGFTINLVSAPTTGVAYSIGFTVLGFS